MILFLAEKEWQARDVAIELGMTYSERQHINDGDMRKLRGIERANVFVLDNAYKRRDFDEVMTMLRAQRCVVWREFDYARPGT